MGTRMGMGWVLYVFLEMWEMRWCLDWGWVFVAGTGSLGLLLCSLRIVADVLLDW